MANKIKMNLNLDIFKYLVRFTNLLPFLVIFCLKCKIVKRIPKTKVQYIVILGEIR